MCTAEQIVCACMGRTETKKDRKRERRWMCKPRIDSTSSRGVTACGEHQIRPTSRLLESPEIAYFSSSISLASAPPPPTPSLPACPVAAPLDERRPGVEVNQSSSPPPALPPPPPLGYSLLLDYLTSEAIWVVSY